MTIGKFITVEGGEGVGKSTQLAAIRTTVEASGYEVIVTREPGGTERAERIRDLLLTPTSETMPQSCELLLMFAARATHLENVIKPALASGKWVLCDRFTDATYAYQGGGRHVPHDQIAWLESLVQGELRPDLTLLLDAPVPLALDRARARNQQQGNADGDRFEREQIHFFDRVRSTYLSIAERQPRRFRVIDASLAIGEVEKRVRKVIGDFIVSTQS